MKTGAQTGLTTLLRPVARFKRQAMAARSAVPVDDQRVVGADIADPQRRLPREQVVHERADHLCPPARGEQRGAIILVVGYVSGTGDANANRRLSSDRATEVAANIDMAKPGNQAVQAVFLGQTKRFSSSIAERNQVCEVWQIDPKK